MTRRLGQPARFVLNLAAFSTLYGLGTPYAGASILAYLTANATMYIGNRRLTFRRADVGLVAGYVRSSGSGSSSRPLPLSSSRFSWNASRSIPPRRRRWLSPRSYRSRSS